MRVLRVSDPCETTVTVSDGHDSAVLVGDGVEPLQAITLANALGPSTELLAVRALEEDELPTAGGGGSPTELEQDLQRLLRYTPLLHAHAGMGAEGYSH